MNNNTRIKYLDTLKLLAIFIVFVTHFINRFNDDYFSLWHTAPTSWLLNGVSGKLGVAIFAVILGYFAYRSKENNITKYVIKRYIYFFLCALFINSIYAALGNLGAFDDTYTAKEVVAVSLTLGDGIFSTFWCIRPFFVASLLSKLNSKAEAGLFIVAIEMHIMFLLTGDVWISICLMGNLVAIAMLNRKILSIFSCVSVRWTAYIAVFFLIKRPESLLTYVIDGICASLLILVLSESRYIRKILEWKPLSAQGKNTMAMYLIHVVVYRLVGMTAGLDSDSSALLFVIILIVSWLLVVVLSFPLTNLLDAMTNLCMNLIMAFQKTDDKLPDDEIGLNKEE